ncbi:hypothetical protein [Pseudosulfitobacter sp. DSM 107133]|uniref:hypothetical protein n=1 Tax=Pseudosulfitobacter sp. DSM 107133 TaxID=2883100 RepID=UPI000DF1D4E7|nr:hypothetical protein [Pseudosulfitobacter sp. DSM 107133]UOA28665.1 hypothetical protein DSM107133_03415 [Pseudosulfitobacter sp. DSM 107133]
MTDRQHLSRTKSGLLVMLDRQGQFSTVDRVSIRRRSYHDDTSTFLGDPVDDERGQDCSVFPRWFVFPLEGPSDPNLARTDDAVETANPEKRDINSYWIAKRLIIPVGFAVLFVLYLTVRSASIESIKTETDPAFFKFKCTLLDLEARVMGDDPTRAMLVRHGCKWVEAPSAAVSHPTRGPANLHTNVLPRESDSDPHFQ